MVHEQKCTGMSYKRLVIRHGKKPPQHATDQMSNVGTVAASKDFHRMMAPEICSNFYHKVDGERHRS